MDVMCQSVYLHYYRRYKVLKDGEVGKVFAGQAWRHEFKSLEPT